MSKLSRKVENTKPQPCDQQSQALSKINMLSSKISMVIFFIRLSHC